MGKPKAGVNVKLLAAIFEKQVHTIDPPGSVSDILPHPVWGERKAVEVAVVMHHRFAFHYWVHWHADERIKPVPNLLTIDWHNDVGGECDFDPKKLALLDIRDETELSLFCWGGLRSLDDGHIAPAMHLNAINDVYVILKQHRQGRRDYEHNRRRSLTDRNGKKHTVEYFDSVEDFLAQHGTDDEHPLILDLDLDYFTTYSGDDFPTLKQTRLVSDSVIRKTLSPSGDLMKWVYPRIEGFTIALEPEYSGGLLGCMHVLGVLSKTLFTRGLLKEGCQWRQPRAR